MDADVALSCAPESWAGEALYPNPTQISGKCSNKGRKTELTKKPYQYFNKEPSAVGRHDMLRLSNWGEDVNLIHHDDRMQLHENKLYQDHPLMSSSLSDRSSRRKHHQQQAANSPEGHGYKYMKDKAKSLENCLDSMSHVPKTDTQYFNLLSHEQSRVEPTKHIKTYNQYTKQRYPPAEVHIEEDETASFGPRLHHQRPNMFSPKSSSSASLKENSPLVVLEVKDGAKFFLRPSESMISDSLLSQEPAASFNSSLFQYSAKQSFPELRDCGLRRPSPVSASVENVTLSRLDNISVTTYRKHSLTSLSSPLRTPEMSVRPGRGLSNLPVPAGLRKPNLSVLSSSPKITAGVGYSDQGVSPFHRRDQLEHSYQASQCTFKPAESSAVLTVDSKDTGNPDESSLASYRNVSHPDSSSLAQYPDASRPDSSSLASYQDASYIGSCLMPLEPALPQLPVLLPKTLSGPVAQGAGEAFSCGFQNVSEILQLKAGIKHDDIVVGPRKSGAKLKQLHSSGIVNPSSSSGSAEVVQTDALSSDCLALTKASVSSQNHFNVSENPILVLNTTDSELLYVDLSPIKISSDATSRQREQKHLPKFQDKTATKDVTSKPELKTTTAHENQPELRASPKGSSKIRDRYPIKDNNTADSSLMRDSDSGFVHSSSESDQSWRPPEGRKLIKRLPHEQSPGRSLEFKPSKGSSISSTLEASSSYETKSLDRKQPSLPQGKLLTKSPPSSLAIQESHKVKSKSSSSIPVRRQPAGSAKLHLLSNIPVSVSRDIPDRSHSYGQLTPASGASDHKELSANVAQCSPGSSGSQKSEPTPRVASISSSGCIHSYLETPVVQEQPKQKVRRRLQVAEDSNVLASTAPAKLPEPENRNILEDNVLNSQLSEPHVKPTGLPKLSNDEFLMAKHPEMSVCESENSTVSMDCASDIVAPNVMQTTGPSEVNKEPITVSASAAKNILEQTESALSSPSHVSAKSRLSKSAEHLLEHTRLTAFNSDDFVPGFDHPESSTRLKYQDSNKSESLEQDLVSPLNKNPSLAKIEIMRQGSHRELCRRGSERAVLPINRNDPSVEDLKKANSLKELCQSVASLLNIDNVKAAEMITTSLSQRQDLVEGLDADSIVDYLSHHGVLDPAVLDGLDNKATVAQRNSAILRHVEEHGNTAVALFINALRQSGQLHLASSLDTQQIIKPVFGCGYFGKERHKGEITIKIEVEELKIVAPREPRSEKIVDTSLLGSPGKSTADIIISDEDDSVKPRCWCFCFSYKNKGKKASQKQAKKTLSSSEQTDTVVSYVYIKDGQSKEETGHVVVTESSSSSLPSKTKSKVSSKKSKSKVGGKSGRAYQDDEAVAESQLPHMKNTHEVSGLGVIDQSVSLEDKYTDNNKYNAKMTLQFIPSNKQLNKVMNSSKEGQKVSKSKPGKDSCNPIIMEYDPKLELIKLRAGQDELASPTRHIGPVGFMCEQWKSSGRHFQQKATLLVDRIVEDLHTDIIKYFEQDRGTLVLDVLPAGCSVHVINICMLRTQVQRLQQEVADDSLLSKMQELFFSKVDIADFDIRGIKLKAVLDEDDLQAVLAELH